MAFYSPTFFEAGEKHVSRRLLDAVKHGVFTFTAHHFQHAQDFVTLEIYISD